MSNADASSALSLPAKLDFEAAKVLHADLSELAGNDVTLDASDVEFLSAYACEALVSAQQRWANDGASLKLQNSSESFDMFTNLLGIDAAKITLEVQ